MCGCMCVWVCVCECECVSVCVCICVCVCECECVRCVRVCFARVIVRVSLLLYTCVSMCLCACLFVHVRMYVCVRVYAFIFHEMCVHSSKKANLYEIVYLFKNAFVPH